jgi:hypothetical protein
MVLSTLNSTLASVWLGLAISSRADLCSVQTMGQVDQADCAELQDPFFLASLSP